MKTKTGKDDDKSIKQNSMVIGGKSPSKKKATDAGPQEFEEAQSTDLRMKPQPLKKAATKTGKK